MTGNLEIRLHNGRECNSESSSESSARRRVSVHYPRMVGVQFAPGWPKIIFVGSLAVVGLPIVAIIVFWLYLIISDFVCKIFGKDKKGKSPPTGASF